MAKLERKTLPISYHTFLLPFEYGKPIKAPNMANWDKNPLTETAIGSTGTAYVSDYAMYQYFTPEARKLLFDSADHLDKDFKHDCIYKLDGNNDQYYEIQKRSKDGAILHEFRLLIRQIRLLLLENGVGMLVLTTENYDHPTLDDIAAINEYGRRICLPYLQDEPPHALTAEKLRLLGREIDFSTATQRYTAEQHTPKADIAQPIKALITELIGTERAISPVIDDRMFVCCLIRNELFSTRHIKAKTLFQDEQLYRLSFIDANDPTCQSDDMLERILRRCVYDRWHKWGTADVITHHSILRLTGEYEGIEASVIRPFITQYVHLAIGALLQRATIMSFSHKCADLSERVHLEMRQKKRISAATKSDIEALNADFVDAQNRIFLDQLSAQEQGIEEFDMLKNELYIESGLTSLTEKVHSLYDLTKIYTEQEENHMLNFIAILGIPLAMADLAMSLLPLCDLLNTLIGAAAGIGLYFAARPLLRLLNKLHR